MYIQRFSIDDKEIGHLLILLKGIQNALLTKELHFCQKGIPKVAYWSHFEKVYTLD